MPRGVPYRVEVTGKGTRTYTFTEIAAGTGVSLSLVSLMLRGKRPVSEYAQPRLAKFFGITVEQLRTPGTITAQVPPVRPLGRAVGRITPNTIQRFGQRPVLDRYAPFSLDSAAFQPGKRAASTEPWWVSLNLFWDVDADMAVCVNVFNQTADDLKGRPLNTLRPTTVCRP